MILKCVSAYRTQTVAYEAGVEIHVSDEGGEFLLRDSPGSFEVVPEVPASTEEEAASDLPAASDSIGAMSTETQAGLVVPDRRARGGRKRASG